MSYHRHSNNRNQIITLVVLGGIIAILAFFSPLSKFTLPMIVIGGIGCGGYYLSTHKSSLIEGNITFRLQNLKENIQQVDSQFKLLEHYLNKKEYSQYATLAHQILPQIKHIQNESSELKKSMDTTIYRRIQKNATDVMLDIQSQLKRLNIDPDFQAISTEKKTILELAPELSTIYNNIQKDHGIIQDKIDQMDNKAELSALHERNMSRFKDILSGYLKIKQSPKDFYNADERLSHAKAALEKFDLLLDETLRKLNEQELKDFEISLQMMENDVANSDIYSP